ncbi:hypothetical protein PJX95_11805 [Serratia rubidaea]|uniref:hypothetical protein n=1 Tax=Serratia rubidaea TaxID=61652 RepID=UPI00234BB833|nr:hypothetical protein [Serratia rubidaea]MDC6118737.1 hypothetical protein [Serratia rubidaea]
MNLDDLTDEQIQQLDSIKSIVGHCVVMLLAQRKTINTANLLSQIAGEMEKIPERSEFNKYRATLEFVGTVSQ